MKLKEQNFLFLKVILIGIIIFLLRSCVRKRQAIVESDNAYLTLSSWDSKKTDKLIAKGKLLFYWKEWPINEQGVFNEKLLTKPDTLQSIATVWTEKGYDPKGFGTYRFFIKQENIEQEAVLNFSRVLGACEVWINGEKQVTHGNLSKNPEESVDNIPALSVGLPKEEFLDVMLLVSSSNTRLGGGFPLQNYMQEKESFYLHKKRRMAFESIITFLILAFGIYQLFIYKNSTQKEKYFLYFALFCLLGGTRQLLVGEAFIYKMFPNISFEVVQRLRYVCFYGGLGFIFLYHHALFPKYFSRKIVLLFSIVPALGIVYVLSTSVFMGTYSAPVFQVFGLLQVTAGIWLIIQTLKDGKPYAKLILTNLIILSVTFLNDLLNAMMIIQTAFIVNIGLLTYVVFQIKLNHILAKQREENLIRMQLEMEQKNAQIKKNEAEISKLLHESYYHLKSKKELADNLKKIKHEDGTISINIIIKNLRSELLEDSQLNSIKNDIEILNYEFSKRLKSKAPHLTNTDLEICTYIHMGLNRKEISRLRSTTIEAVRKSRYRVRKKLALTVDDDLEGFLKNV